MTLRTPSRAPLYESVAVYRRRVQEVTVCRSSAVAASVGPQGGAGTYPFGREQCPEKALCSSASDPPESGVTAWTEVRSVFALEEADWQRK